MFLGALFFWNSLNPKSSYPLSSGVQVETWPKDHLAESGLQFSTETSPFGKIIYKVTVF